MRKVMKNTTAVLACMAVVGAIFVSSASATPNTDSGTAQAIAAANGACGGGKSISSVINGWKSKGVLDDVARSTGQTPGLDGSARSIVKGGIVKTIVVKGGYVTNYTCSGGKFKKVPTKKYIPAGSVYWVPEKYAPAACKKGRTKHGYEARCGNKQVGNLLVKRPCKKKPPKKPKPPKPPANGCSQENTAASGCAVQTNKAEQDCKATVGGTWNGNMCTITQNNNNCSNQNTGSNNGEVNQGGNCNVTNTCSNVNSPGGVVNCGPTSPPPPPKCPDGRPIPSNGDCDRPPTISNDGMTAHTMPGDNRQLWFIVTDPDGDNIDSFNILSINPNTGSPGPNPYAHVAGIQSVTVLGSNQPCPAKSKCFTATLWGDSPGTAEFKAIASAGGKPADPLFFTATIHPVIQ